MGANTEMDIKLFDEIIAWLRTVIEFDMPKSINYLCISLDHYTIGEAIINTKGYALDVPPEKLKSFVSIIKRWGHFEDNVGLLNIKVERAHVVCIDMPIFSQVTNRVEVIFRGEAPV